VKRSLLALSKHWERSRIVSIRQGILVRGNLLKKQSIPVTRKVKSPSSVGQDVVSESSRLLGKSVLAEIELFIEADGTVVFADLAAEMIPVAEKLNPDHSLACDVSPSITEKDERASA